ncbi:GtrA family protein [Bordetella petrii]|nr:GtrA family protein [Bordetella petrii]
MSLLMKEVRWFILVGSGATATHWLVVVACVEWLLIPPLVANVAGWIAAFVVSFVGHYFLTFRHLDALWTIALRRFFFVSACGFLLNEVMYAWLLDITKERYEAVLTLVLLGVALATFLASRLWAFGQRSIN